MTKSNNPPGFKAVPWTNKKGEKKVAYYYRPSRKTADKSSGKKDPRKPIPLGTDYREALKKWAEIHGTAIEAPAPGTLADDYAAYMKWAEKRNVSKLSLRTIKDRKGYWKKLAPCFGHLNADKFESQWALEYFERRSSQVSAKKELKFLSVLFNWSRARGRMRQPNPLTGLFRQLHVDEKRDIYVHDTCYQLTWQHGTQLVRDAMDFTYLCGNRPNETERANKRNISGDELTIEIAKTEKSGLAKKRLPITGELAAYIDRQRQKAPSSVYLVSDENGQPLKTKSAKFRREWAAARDAAEAAAKAKNLDYTRFRLMDIRAKAATDIAEQHGLEAARKLLGHTTQKQTADYIRNIQGISAQAIDAIKR